MLIVNVCVVKRSIGRGRSDGNVIRSSRFPIDRAVDTYYTVFGSIANRPPALLSRE